MRLKKSILHVLDKLILAKRKKWSKVSHMFSLKLYLEGCDIL